ncbi:CmlA/FloR family chloramphenicol efflux MFS transporter [Stenotrophomonas sp.]|uniref:CmlA/FloR family chloramphenicol efflux MFS transporter n=1 Tax=Stenotrophomonas sp. TaxID=69392 RepID=UPI002899D7BB|nr:CmlA/FloR family chloramphenicol efflux MFS transporter [Stenotrophomonas sp.]
MQKSQGRAWPHSVSTALLLMAPFDFLASLAMDVYLPVIPQMPNALDTSAFVVQLTLSAYLLILGLGQLVFGPLSDRIGRRPVVLGGSVIYALSSFGLAAADDGGVFLALRLLQAIGASAALVATFATVRDVFSGRPESATVYGLLSSMLAIVPAAGPVIGALLSDTFGWRSIFVLLGTLAAAASIHAFLNWRETAPRVDSTSRSSIRSIFSSGPFWVYTLGFSSAMGAFFVFFSISPRVLMDVAGYSQMAFSVAFATVAVVMMVAARSSRKWVVAWGTRRCFATGTVLMALGAMILALCTIQGKPGFVAFIMPMWIIAAGIVLVVSVTANGALAAFDDKAGTAVALYYAIQGVVVSGLGTLATVVFGGGTPWALVGFCGVMCGVNVAGICWLTRRSRT